MNNNVNYIKATRKEFNNKNIIKYHLNLINHIYLKDDKEQLNRWKIVNILNNIANHIIDGKIICCESGNYMASIISTRPLIECIVKQFYISILKPDLINYAAYCKSFDVDLRTLDKITKNSFKKFQKMFDFRKMCDELYFRRNNQSVNNSYTIHNKTIHSDPRIYFGPDNQFEITEDINKKLGITRLEPLHSYVLLNRIAMFQYYHDTNLQSQLHIKLNKYIANMLYHHKQKLLGLLPNKPNIINKLIVYDYLNTNDIRELLNRRTYLG